MKRKKKKIEANGILPKFGILNICFNDTNGNISKFCQYTIFVFHLLRKNFNPKINIF